MKKENDNWRTLSRDQLIEGLVAIGILREAAEEYPDDPNSIVKMLRERLNAWMSVNRIKGERL